MDVIDLLETSPVIAAIKSKEGLDCCLESECNVVFVLYGTVCDITQIVQKIKDSGKTPIVHVDLISGLSSKEVAVDYIKRNTLADGIISTKPMLVKRGKELGFISIQRTFVIDSMALATLKKQISVFKPDAIEIMPGIMPKILKEVRRYADTAIIAGGLLSDKKDVIEAFAAGADAVSTTKKELWYI